MDTNPTSSHYHQSRRHTYCNLDHSGRCAPSPGIPSFCIVPVDSPSRAHRFCTASDWPFYLTDLLAIPCRKYRNGHSSCRPILLGSSIRSHRVYLHRCRYVCMVLKRIRRMCQSHSCYQPYRRDNGNDSRHGLGFHTCRRYMDLSRSHARGIHSFCHRNRRHTDSGVHLGGTNKRHHFDTVIVRSNPPLFHNVDPYVLVYSCSDSR